MTLEPSADRSAPAIAMESDSSRDRLIASEPSAEVRQWRQLPVARRCRIVGQAANQLAAQVDRLVDAATSEVRTDPVETITAEILPTCAAWQWIGRYGPRTLRPRRLGARGRPAWLWGVRSEVRRVPMGRVLILGAWNYPLFLPGAQAGASVAAGNQTWIKPAPGCAAITGMWVDALLRAGIPDDLLGVLPESVESAIGAIDSGMDLVVMTGSARTGRAVLERCARTLTPAIIEASGCDAVIALPGVDSQRLSELLQFGWTLNSGATCIGPRRLLVRRDDWDRIQPALLSAVKGLEPVSVHPSARQAAAEAIDQAIDMGATVHSATPFDSQSMRQSGQMSPVLLTGVTSDMAVASSDVFAPVLSVMLVDQVDDSVRIVNECPYRLAASVVGDATAARAVAERLDVGTVVINDLVVPTADPRVPFGGRGQSGFGVTRGPEGLLAMTACQTISVRRGRWMPHLRPRAAGDQNLLSAVTQWNHAGSLSKRFAAVWRLMRR